MALALLLTSACGGGDAGRGAGDPEGADGPFAFRVVATTGMIADVAARIGGEGVQVTGLMGPGVDPHLFRASAGDIRTLAEADLILYNGLDLEARLGEVLARMDRGARTLAVAETLPASRLIPLADADGAVDPHVWMDVGLWRAVAGAIADAFGEVHPEGEARYRENLRALDGELEALDQWIRDTLSVVPESRRVLVTAHDAFGYFGRAYDFEVRGLQGVSTVTEAGAQDVQALVRFLVEREIPAVFVESSVSPRTLEAVRQGVAARGGTVRLGGTLHSDALGSPETAAATYIGMMQENVRALVAGLAGVGLVP
jgi:manganese/zinc/iron transport system substrate-binding protein